MEVQMKHQPSAAPTEFLIKNFNKNGIKHKTGLINLVAGLGNISKAVVSRLF